MEFNEKTDYRFEIDRKMYSILHVKELTRHAID